MEHNGGGAPEVEPNSAVQGRWVWKKVFVPWLSPPSAAHRSPERSAGAGSDEPVLKEPRLEMIAGGCWFWGEREGETVANPKSLSFKEVTDRLSSTSEKPQAVNGTPTPDSPSAAPMISKCRDTERQERLVDPTHQNPNELIITKPELRCCLLLRFKQKPSCSGLKSMSVMRVSH